MRKREAGQAKQKQIQSQQHGLIRKQLELEDHIVRVDGIARKRQQKRASHAAKPYDQQPCNAYVDKAGDHAPQGISRIVEHRNKLTVIGYLGFLNIDKE